MRRRLEQLGALAPWEWRLLAVLAFLLPAVGAALWLIGFNRTRALLDRSSEPARKPGTGSGSPEPHDTARRIARLVAIAASRGAYRANCLRQSLALRWLLKRRGIDTELRIGVRKEGNALRAHAWVEHEGSPVGQGPLDHSPYPELPARIAP
jgi:hypothetical protein